MAVREYSANGVLATMEVGERLFIETTKAKYVSVMHAYNPAMNRRPVELKKMQFKTALWTAVQNNEPGTATVLVSVERVK